jgi:type IV pilus assembly protein PilV
MAAVDRVSPAVASSERGFSLIEVLVATLVLSTGLLGLAGLFAVGVQRMGSSKPMLTAREKAREAIESVHAARDTGEASWATIRNVADGGVFLNGAQAIKDPGDDGLVNTSDDGEAEVDEDLFTREILISDLNFDGSTEVNPNLRQVKVIVRYKVAQTWQTYTVTTYISSYS